MRYAELSLALGRVCASRNLSLSDTAALWSATAANTDYQDTDSGAVSVGPWRASWGTMHADGTLDVPPGCTALAWTREGVERGLWLAGPTVLAVDTRYLIISAN